MKIFCVISNYATGPGETAEWYTLPDSTLLRSNNPFFIPDFDTEFVGIPSIAVRIDRLGKNIAPKFASRYYSEATMAVCVVAKNLLRELSEAGKPWSRAVAFDRSCLMGDFVDKNQLLESRNIKVKCGSEEYGYEFDRINRSIDEAVSMVSSDNTMKTGDIVLAAMMPEGLPLHIGDTLDVTLPSDRNLLTIRMR